MILEKTQAKFTFLTITDNMDLNLGRLYRLLEDARKAKKITQDELAEKALGISGQQYANLIHKRSDMTMEQFKKICIFLEISAINLVLNTSPEFDTEEKLRGFLNRGLNELSQLLKDLDDSKKQEQ